MKLTRVALTFLLSFFFLAPFGHATSNKAKTKFYNFDDLLINGKIKKPQILWTDAKQKVRFERLLKLKKDFIPKLRDTKRDPSLR